MSILSYNFKAEKKKKKKRRVLTAQMLARSWGRERLVITPEIEPGKFILEI
jgi:hypothetical protein